MDRKEKVLRQLEEAVERAHFWEEHNKEIFVKGYPNFTVFLDDKKSKISPVIDIETFIEMIKLSLYDKKSNNEPVIDLICDSPYLPRTLKIRYQDKTYKTLISSI